LAKANTLRMHYVYILKSKVNKNKIYTGITNNLQRRLKEHNSNKISFTSQFTPWIIETYVGFSKLN